MHCPHFHWTNQNGYGKCTLKHKSVRWSDFIFSRAGPVSFCGVPHNSKVTGNIINKCYSSVCYVINLFECLVDSIAQVFFEVINGDMINVICKKGDVELCSDFLHKKPPEGKTNVFGIPKNCQI